MNTDDKSIFNEARRKSGSDRDAYLDDACGDDAALRAKVDRAQAFRTAGADYSGLLSDALGALSGRAEFLALSVGRERDGGREIELRARTAADPIRSTAALRAIETELAGDSRLRGVRLDVPSGLNPVAGSGGRDGAIEFRVEARAAE